jgi:hypothetical protein
LGIFYTFFFTVGFFVVVFFLLTFFSECGAVSSVMRGGLRLTELFFLATTFFFGAGFLATVFLGATFFTGAFLVTVVFAGAFVVAGFFVTVAASALSKLPNNKEKPIIKLVNIKNGLENFINYLKL